MRFVISPAKKMTQDDSFAWTALPHFVDRAETLMGHLKQMDAASLQALWKCSDALTAQNVERLKYADVRHPQAPAVFAYDGIQYTHLAATVMTQPQLDYLDRHLRILSGLYGLLRPFDGVTAYRLEMQAKLAVGTTRDLYAFWGRQIYDALAAETDTIVNLASLEYARAVTPYVTDLSRCRMVTCLFGNCRDGKLVQKSTQAKAARGMFMHWCAEHRIAHVEDLAAFNDAGYTLSRPLSTPDSLVFTQATPCRHARDDTDCGKASRFA